MTMQEQIKMSCLEITTSSPLQWNSTNQWSPLGGRQREGQACVVVSSNDENDAPGAQTIVVVGGRTGRYATNATNSVIIWDPSIQNWRDGPNLNDRRWALVAVVCRDKVYAIGGSDENRALDTMESIQVSSLMDNNSEWTRLQCRMSSPRHGCAAVVVHNRYVVILGGRSGIPGFSSVDILDTAPPQNNNNNGEPTIVAGPSMILQRCGFGAAVMDNCIFVVGGRVDQTSVESLALPNSSESFTFPNSTWRLERRLTLSAGRRFHAVAKVGLCLIVAGGHNSRDNLMVEVLDVRRGIVWRLPNLISGRQMGCSMVSLSNCLLVLGGNHSVDSVESLALAVNTKHQRCYKLLKFLIGIEFLGRPTRKRNG